MASLFTNVPIEPLLDFLHRKHAEGGVPLPQGYTIDGFLDLIRLCVKSTVFSFNGKFYRQKQGVSMGSPLAPVLACLYMEYFETELRLSLNGPQPSYWVRYIDDILIQWPHSLEEFNIFLQRLLQIEPLIQLTTEWELKDPAMFGFAEIPFLDVKIMRSPQGLSFTIYRKPTATDMYTHFYSAHPLPTKQGILIGLFLRAFRLCSTDHLSTEIQHISKGFLRLKYPNYVIRKALSTAKWRFHNPVTRERTTSKYHLPLPCHPDYEPLRRPLASFGVSTSFSSSNTLRSHLSKTGPRTPTASELPCVYVVDCKQCPEGVYYGESGISLDKRITQHRGSIAGADVRNALYVHTRDNPGHTYDLDGARVIYISNSEPKRFLVESSIIATTTNSNLRPGNFPVCKLTAPAVIQTLNLSSKIPTHTSATPTIATPSTLPSAPPTLPSAPPTSPLNPPSSVPNLSGPSPTTISLSPITASHVVPTSATAISPAPSQPTLPSAPPTSPLNPPSSVSNPSGPSPTTISLSPITASHVVPTSATAISPAPSQPSASSNLPIRPPHLLLTDTHISSPMGPVAARTRRNRAIHRRNLNSPYSRSSSQNTCSQSTVSITSSPPPIPASAPQMGLPSVSTIRRPRGRPRCQFKPYTVPRVTPD